MNMFLLKLEKMGNKKDKNRGKQEKKKNQKSFELKDNDAAGSFTL